MPSQLLEFGLKQKQKTNQSGSLFPRFNAPINSKLQHPLSTPGKNPQAFDIQALGVKFEAYLSGMENLNHNCQVFPAELKCFIICYGGVLSKKLQFYEQMAQKKRVDTNLARIIFGGSNAHSLFCHRGDVGASN